MKKDKFTIGYFYYSFYPVKGGASVHGYNLAKQLVKRGHKLLSLNGKEDPYTQKKRGLWGLFYILWYSDIVFVRLDYFKEKPRNYIPIIARLFGKKVIAEINSPADELSLLGASRKKIKAADRFMRFLLKFVDHLLVVSQPLRDYCIDKLEFNEVTVIENGGEIFNLKKINIDQGLKSKVTNIKKKFDRIVIWAGSPNKMQEMDFLLKIENTLSQEYAFFLITKEKFDLPESFQSKKNIFVFSSLNRQEVKWLIKQGDAGLAFYGNYDWSRYGFYNSSLKVYEYLANQLWVITNKKELAKVDSRVRLITDPDQINEMIRELDIQSFPLNKIRTWEKVANEFEKQIMEVINND